MKLSLRSLGAAELGGRRALVRVDYNVPIRDGHVEDSTRVDASLPTLRRLLECGARPILLSHLGRPKGQSRPELSLAPVAELLAKRLGSEVRFVAPCDGPEALEASRELPEGVVLLLENTRFLDGETANDPDLARRFATLGDLYISDAFGSLHRAHASTAGVTQFLRPALAGLLVERELESLGRLRRAPEAPFLVAFGGAKIGDKIDLIEAFLDRADRLLIGGAMANTFLRAAGMGTGRSLVEEGAVEVAARILATGDDTIRLPEDVIVTADPSDPAAPAWSTAATAIPEDAAAVDIGPFTRSVYASAIGGCRTFFWNGPMGLFEDARFAAGTFELAAAAAAATMEGAFTVIGGGDSASAIRSAGLMDRVSHVSTGGGAALEFLARGVLPGVDVLDDA
jgi:phosphoglycerate kinase